MAARILDNTLPTPDNDKLDPTSPEKHNHRMAPIQPVGASDNPSARGQTDKHFEQVQRSASSNAVPSQPDLTGSLYKGYTFYKADPAPGQKATWSRVERTQMHLNQSEFFKMVQKRANKLSAAKQYQMLSITRRAHINQLIHEQRQSNPQVDWSCVYAKERMRPSRPRNACRRDDETVSMDIIIMKRPMKTQSYPRTPMGDLVDLGTSFEKSRNAARNLGSKWADININNPNLRAGMGIRKDRPRHSLSRPLQSHRRVSDRIESGPKYVVQGPQPQPISVTSPFTRLDLSHDPGLRSSNVNMKTAHTNIDANCREHERNRYDAVSRWNAAVNKILAGANLSDANSSQKGSVSDQLDWSSGASSDKDDDSTISEQSDEASATDDSEFLDHDGREPTREKVSHQQRSLSPELYERNYGPYCRRQENHRSLERRHDRTHPLGGQPGKAPIRSIGPIRRTRRGRSGDSDSEAPTKRPRFQRASDHEPRNMIHDQHEIRIGRWKQFLESQARMLETTIDQARQLEGRRSIQETSPTHNCNCPCSRGER